MSEMLIDTSARVRSHRIRSCLLRTSVTTGAGLALALIAATPAAATGPADVSGGVSHEDETYLIPADPECGSEHDLIETQSGVERLRIVEHGDTFHFVAGESVTTTTTSDDPELQVADRKITDAVVFHSIRGDQVVVFSETFMDRDTYWGDIQVRVTYVEVDGDTKVDRFTGKNLPPDGC